MIAAQWGKVKTQLKHNSQIFINRRELDSCGF
nr:MAG TPA: hypothetical protein [Caudoviricetes sp.]